MVETAMRTLAPFLDNLIIKKPITYQGIVVFPVCIVHGDFDAAEDGIISLREGLAAGWLSAEETGRMERVRLRNKNGGAALILDGETLIGAAQNRMLNTSALLRSGASAEFASCCVEVHRWDTKSADRDEKRTFETSSFAYGALRRLKMQTAEKSLMKDRTAEVGQKAVWQNIVNRFTVTGATTRTLDMHELYEFWDPALKIYEQRFYMGKGQRGMVTFIAGGGWFIDVFLNYDVLAKYVRPLVRSYAFDDLIRIESGVQSNPAKAPSTKDAQEKLKSLKLVPCHPYTPGVADENTKTSFFFSARAAFGLAVIDEGRLLHLSACSRE